MSRNSSDGNHQYSGKFTGKHMMAIMCAFFGVIIAVNLTMATLAHTSWSGFVVKNSYVAGLEINTKIEEGRRQAALGWSPALSIEDGVLRFALKDAENQPILLDGGTATLRRPVGDADDVTVALMPRNDVVEAEIAVADGAWIIEVHADVSAGKAARVGLEHPYRETQRIQLHGGRTR